MSGPPGLSQLAGVRVVDLTQALSGPYCTMMLADLGADVVKVESPHRGDDARHWGPPFVGDDAAYFLAVNRNKRSVALDLKDEHDRAQVRALVAQADVMVENWRPGTASRLGLDPEELRAAHPRLVVCSISGYGQDQGTRSGYDQIVQGTSGVMRMTGPPGEPTKWGVPAADLAAGMFAANGILAALLDRERTGVGARLDVAMQDCLVSLLTHHGARYLHTGEAPVSDHNGHATITPYGSFEVLDGFVNICAGNDAQFQRLCTALGCTGLGEDPRYATNPLRTEHQQELLGALAPVLAGLRVEQVVAALETAGVPVGPVTDIGAVLDDSRTDDRSMVVTFERDDTGPTRVVNSPWKVDGVAASVRRPPPHLGQHTDEVLAELAVLRTERG